MVKENGYKLTNFTRRYKLMSLIDEHIKIGNWLFRNRSYLPIFGLILYFIGLYQVKDSYLFQDKYWLIFCFTTSFFGQIIRILTIANVPIGTSGRNTKKQRASSINVLGIYSIVRHPLYLGNYFMWLGIFMLIPIIWLQIIFTLLYWIYYERIMIAEENYLQNKFGEDYFSWSKNVPAFIPSFKNYKKKSSKYSIKNIIRREYTSFSAMIILFMILKQLNNGLILSDWQINSYSKWVLILTISIYIMIRCLKTYTKLFK